MTEKTDLEKLREHLNRSQEITVTVTGRKSGHAISITIWFVLEDKDLYLLPVKGSETQWYRNVVQHPMLGIKAGNTKAELKVFQIADAGEVSSVVERFRKKYGASEVKKYYSKFDVALMAPLS